MIVVGLDLSLTATGMAIVAPAAQNVVTIKSKGKKDDTLLMRQARLVGIVDTITSTVLPGSHVAIESAAHGAVSGHHHDRSGLWWMVVHQLIERGCHVYEVAPTQVKKYVAGKGNASKMEVMAAAIKRYPGMDIEDDNQADAVGLAALLSRALGKPIDGDLPKANLAALDKFSAE